MYIIGVDPGKTGAAAHIEDGGLTKVYPFKGKIEECRKIADACVLDPIFFIEKVTASPNMGNVSAFTFGKWAEAVESTALLSVCEVHMVRPVIWQNAIGVFSGGNKKLLYEHAKKLFPKEYKAKMFNKETSDSVLIAHYGWRYMVHQQKEKKK